MTQQPRSLLNQAGNSSQTPVGLDQAAPDQGDAQQGEQPVHDWQKRYKDLQSFNSRKINELTNTIEDLQKQGVPKVQAPRTPEEMEAFKSQNPDMYAVIQHMATDISQAQLQGYDQKMAGVQNDLLDTRMDRATLTIKASHPDFEVVIESREFEEWALRQTTTVQDWVYNNPDNPELAIQALSLYKYESGQTQNQATSTSDLDVNVRSNGTIETSSNNHPAKIWKESEIRSMNPQEYAKWDETIKLAQQEGRIQLGQ